MPYHDTRGLLTISSAGVTAGGWVDASTASGSPTASSTAAKPLSCSDSVSFTDNLVAWPLSCFGGFWCTDNLVRCREAAELLERLLVHRADSLIHCCEAAEVPYRLLAR